MPRTKRGRKPAVPKPKPKTKGQSNAQRAKRAKTFAVASITDCPEDLGEYGKEYWQSLAPQLITLHILKPIHLTTFRVLCECWHEYRTLHKWLMENPDRMTFITDKGYICESPQLRQRDKALMQLQKLWLKFGLTPHALAGLQKTNAANQPGLPPIAEFARKKYDGKTNQ
jgi:P27 family predicted phage terminase small subunit